MSNYLHSPITSREVLGKAIGRIPKIVYIDRQDTSRHLVPGGHEALVGYLRGMSRRGEVEFVHGLREQIESVLDADVRPFSFLFFSSPSPQPLVLLQYLLLLPNRVVLLFSSADCSRDVLS
jgi:hypothetical protein